MKFRIVPGPHGNSWRIQTKEWFRDWDTVKIILSETDADLPAAYERARQLVILARCAENCMALNEMGPPSVSTWRTHLEQLP